MTTYQQTEFCYNCMTPLPSGAHTCPHCGVDVDSVQSNANQLAVGSILAGTYLVGRALGQGGFGITYIGYDINLELRVAIKEYFPQGFVSRAQTGRGQITAVSGEMGAWFIKSRDSFVQEAKTLAKFAGEPAIVNVRGFFLENGTAYIVMDYVEGKTLKQLAAENGGKRPSKRVLAYLEPVMRSLQKVHDAGLLHRDIAPDNIMVRASNDSAVLLDFGAARQMSVVGEHSNTINVKHGFAPEEQYRTHGEQGPWTDIYAMCATIYKLTTGVTPLQAMDRAMSAEPLTPPNKLGADLTALQETAVMRGLSVHGRNRQQSMRELETAFSVKQPQSFLAKQKQASEKPVPQAGATVSAAGGSVAEKLLGVSTAPTERKISKAGLLLFAGGAVALVLLVLGLIAAGKKEKPQSIEASDVQQAAEATAEPTTVPAPVTVPLPTAVPTTAPILAEDVQKNFEYENADGGIVITRYIGTDTEVVIPDNVDGVPVVGIGEEAFSGSIYQNNVSYTVCKTIKSVVIPDSVTGISESAFNQCEALANITIPGSLTSICNSVFAHCKALNNVTLPDGMTEIGESAFSYCTALTNLSLPESVVSIGFDAFEGTPWIYALMNTAQSDYTVLGDQALYIYSGEEKNVIVPEGIKHVFFYDNDAISSVTLPRSLEDIDSDAFNNCRSLQSIIIPGSVKRIGARAFKRCWNLTNVEIEEGVTYIGNDAFIFCDSLESVTMPSSITQIGSGLSLGIFFTSVDELIPANLRMRCPICQRVRYPLSNLLIRELFVGGTVHDASNHLLPLHDAATGGRRSLPALRRGG